MLFNLSFVHRAYVDVANTGKQSKQAPNKPSYEKHANALLNTHCSWDSSCNLTTTVNQKKVRSCALLILASGRSSHGTARQRVTNWPSRSRREAPDGRARPLAGLTQSGQAAEPAPAVTHRGHRTPPAAAAANNPAHEAQGTRTGAVPGSPRSDGEPGRAGGCSPLRPRAGAAEGPAPLRGGGRARRSFRGSRRPLRAAAP